MLVMFENNMQTMPILLPLIALCEYLLKHTGTGVTQYAGSYTNLFTSLYWTQPNSMSFRTQNRELAEQTPDSVILNNHGLKPVRKAHSSVLSSLTEARSPKSSASEVVEDCTGGSS